ncbi:UNVERIFIED_CONTAM: Xyloglucan endotransglucosylase/hydrolase protein 15 [Sesamum radiatum]|uniref:Xyloglucan endotransglucosylase/hydrolase n=1 Tax=Sesamum radiatum TaxID=300843 RepID=A0AAW2T507_SESRA
MAVSSDSISLPTFVMLSLLMIIACFITPSAGNFYKDVDINWGDGRGKIVEGGRGLTLSLDQYSGRVSSPRMSIYSLASQGSAHDEIDFEFLGNSSGEPYTVHTNVYAQGKGDKEQQFRLWFDPSAAFHTYSIVWNPQRIIVFHNHGGIGVPFPTSQPMRVQCSLWNADDWATQGGRVKTDWTKAPFVAYYRNFKINACVNGSTGGSCGSTSGDTFSNQEWQTQELDSKGRNRLRWVHQKHMIYNYCADIPRFPQGIPPECQRSRF